MYIYIYYILHTCIAFFIASSCVIQKNCLCMLKHICERFTLQNLGACTYKHIFILTYRLNRQPSRWPQSKSPEWLAVALILAQQKQESTSKWEICLLVFFQNQLSWRVTWRIVRYLELWLKRWASNLLRMLDHIITKIKSRDNLN